MSEVKDWRKICAACHEGEPPKDCEVGTAEEQNLRHGEWCRKHGIDGAMDVPCGSPNWHCHLCFARWSQMDYESEVG